MTTVPRSAPLAGQHTSPTADADRDGPDHSSAGRDPLGREGLELTTGLPLGRRVANLIAILLPFAALILAIAYTWGWGVSWTALALLFGMYLLTGIGVTVGFHRLFAHKSFSTGPIVTATLAILGSMSVQGSLTRWVAVHRSHHQHSDCEHDPHSPHNHGEGFWNKVKGFWNAHIGWMLKDSDMDLDRYVPDLKRSRLLNRIDKLTPVWALASLAIPALIGGLVTMSWVGAILGLIWGGLIRVALVHHITWSVNSICHLWGTRPFNSHDHSRNNPIVGVLAFGEGWHNNHHAFPASARHGLRWWQIDTSWMLIWTLSKLGLAWNVRLPAEERMERKRR
jgi:stearoyl-CoA desaturase (delta-9 desaturase)